MNPPPMLMLILAPGLGLAVNIAAQCVLGRLPLSIGHVRRQFVSFGCGLAATALWLGHALPPLALAPLDVAGWAALHLLSYAMAGFVFFHVINMNISSLRIRMLKEYLHVHPQPLPDRVLRKKYAVRAMLDARLERLVSGGQITRRDGRYYFQPGPVAAIGQLFAFLKRFLLRQ